MQRKLYFGLMLFALACSTAHAQQHTYHWYFGKKIGLNFNQMPPQPLFNGTQNSIEGSSTISDNNGNLLFYTNGTFVINRQHVTMKNGNNLLGNVSSTSNSVIVPMPGSVGIYYLFTVGAANNQFEGFRFSIIDMNKEGGLGEVTLKNEIVEEESFEKLAAVRHCNKKDVWIVTKVWNSDAYNAYLLTAAGFTYAPIRSNMGLTIGGYFNNALGALKFSADGKKLIALHSFENDMAQLMEFNNVTGEITNSINFKPNAVSPNGSYMGVYGAEFSPDSRLLYISSNNSVTESAILYQFDISSMHGPTITGSKQVISITNPFRGGSLQVGPDQKIFYTMYDDNALSVIENPNVYGPGCNFSYHKISFAGATANPLQYGLPSFIAGDLDKAIVPFDFSSVSNCISATANFTMNKTTGADSVRWDFGDGNQSVAFAPSHTYASTGTYTVTLKVYKPNCENLFEEIKHAVVIGSATANKFLPNDTTLCEIKDVNLSPSVVAQSYLWNTGETTGSITIRSGGTYWLKITNNGCSSTDTFTLRQLLPITVSLGKDTSVCVSNPVILDAGSAASYLWNTGSTTQTLTITKPGSYIVQVKSVDGCTARDTVNIVPGDCGIYVPSAFTPNGDGINDGFSIGGGVFTPSFSLKVFNRYGNIVFQTTDQLAKWDGTFKGLPVPMGMYLWYISYKKDDKDIPLKGTVLLLR